MSETAQKLKAARRRQHRRLALRLADTYNPRIWRDNGKLDSDYHWRQTQLAVRAALKAAAAVAERPYGDEVQAFGGDEPLLVGHKIGEAIRKL